MGFYNWLEKTSEGIDANIEFCKDYGVLTGLGCLIPTERAKRMLDILANLEWIGWDYDAVDYLYAEKDVNDAINQYVMDKYITRYNELKYWWMPSK